MKDDWELDDSKEENTLEEEDKWMVRRENQKD